MKKTLLLVLPVLIAITIVSCQKELSYPDVTFGGNGSGSGGTGSGTGSSSITGNWTFVSSSAVTQSAEQYSFGGTTFKTVTNSAYTTTNNKGTIVITSNSMAITGMSYDVSTTATAISYENNVAVDTISQPFTFSLPSYSATSAYKLVGADSIYFPAAGLDPSGASGSGGHYSLSGNILKLTSAVVKDTTIDLGGISASQHSTGTATTTLQRQ